MLGPHMLLYYQISTVGPASDVERTNILAKCAQLQSGLDVSFNPQDWNQYTKHVYLQKMNSSLGERDLTFACASTGYPSKLCGLLWMREKWAKIIMEHIQVAKALQGHFGIGESLGTIMDKYSGRHQIPIVVEPQFYATDGANLQLVKRRREERQEEYLRQRLEMVSHPHVPEAFYKMPNGDTTSGPQVRIHLKMLRT